MLEAFVGIEATSEGVEKRAIKRYSPTEPRIHEASNHKCISADNTGPGGRNTG